MVNIFIDYEGIKKIIVKTLKDYGIDWILEERQVEPTENDFGKLISEIMLALKGNIII